MPYISISKYFLDEIFRNKTCVSVNEIYCMVHHKLQKCKLGPLKLYSLFLDNESFIVFAVKKHACAEFLKIKKEGD
jgi:hypothetical protein